MYNQLAYIDTKTSDEQKHVHLLIVTVVEFPS